MTSSKWPRRGWRAFKFRSTTRLPSELQIAYRTLRIHCTEWFQVKTSFIRQLASWVWSKKKAFTCSTIVRYSIRTVWRRTCPISWLVVVASTKTTYHRYAELNHRQTAIKKPQTFWSNLKNNLQQHQTKIYRKRLDKIRMITLTILTSISVCSSN